MDIQKTTARLRRTFAYRTDDNNNNTDDDSDDGAALDEQEQEELIAQLAAHNARRNAQSRALLLALPALSAVPYLVALVGRGPGSGSGSGSGSVLVAMLALSSLGCTVWMLHRLPPGVTGLQWLDRWAATSSTTTTSTTSGQVRRRSGFSPAASDDVRQVQLKGPLETYLPYLNLSLCAVLVLIGAVSKQQHAPQAYWGHVGLGHLPAAVYAVVLLAKVVMGGVDPERELSELKYEFKGA